MAQMHILFMLHLFLILCSQADKGYPVSLSCGSIDNMWLQVSCGRSTASFGFFFGNLELHSSDRLNSYSEISKNLGERCVC